MHNQLAVQRRPDCSGGERECVLKGYLFRKDAAASPAKVSKNGLFGSTVKELNTTVWEQCYSADQGGTRRESNKWFSFLGQVVAQRGLGRETKGSWIKSWRGQNIGGVW